MTLLGLVQTALAVVLMVGTLVLVHEAGHFTVARLFGVTVKVFSIGVGPRAFGFRWGKTDYRVSWIPIGGYVRWVGADPFSDGGADEDDDWVDHQGSFIHKPAWQRLLIVLAGPATNLILPIGVFTALFIWGEPQMEAKVGYVVPGSVAEAAGVQPGDRLVALGEQRVATWVDVVEALEAAPPSGAVPLTLRRGEAELTVSVAAPDGEGATHFGDYGLDPRAWSTVIHVDDAASPAGRAGLRSGDQITAVDGVAVASWPELVRALEGKRTVAVEARRRAEDKKDPSVEVRASVVTDPAWAPPRYPADDATWATWGLANGMLGVGAITTHLADNTAPPALCQGLKVGDRVLRIGERDITRWPDIEAAIAGSLPKGGLGESASRLTFVVRRDGAIVELPITPAVVQEVDASRRYTVVARVGFGPGGGYVYPDDVVRSYDPVHAASRAVEATVGSAGRIIEQLGLIATGGAPASQNVGGPIEIFSTAAEAAERGWFDSAATVALLSISLGVLNLLPVPVLDGGQIVMYLAEWVRGRPLPWRLRERLQQVGVILLLSLLLVVSAWDVGRRFLPESAPEVKCA